MFNATNLLKSLLYTHSHPALKLIALCRNTYWMSPKNIFTMQHCNKWVPSKSILGPSKNKELKKKIKEPFHSESCFHLNTLHLNNSVNTQLCTT